MYWCLQRQNVEMGLMRPAIYTAGFLLCYNILHRKLCHLITESSVIGILYNMLFKKKVKHIFFKTK